MFELEVVAASSVFASSSLYFFMAARRSRCGHYIFQLWFLACFFLLFFLAYSQQLEIGCLPYFRA